VQGDNFKEYVATFKRVANTSVMSLTPNTELPILATLY
jgi:hypothetical protein